MVTQTFFLVKRQIFSPVTIIALMQLKQKGLCRTCLPRRLCHAFFPHVRSGELRDEPKECLSESRLISYLLSNVH